MEIVVQSGHIVDVAAGRDIPALAASFGPRGKEVAVERQFVCFTGTLDGPRVSDVPHPLTAVAVGRSGTLALAVGDTRWMPGPTAQGTLERAGSSSASSLGSLLPGPSVDARNRRRPQWPRPRSTLPRPSEQTANTSCSDLLERGRVDSLAAIGHCHEVRQANSGDSPLQKDPRLCRFR